MPINPDHLKELQTTVPLAIPEQGSVSQAHLQELGFGSDPEQLAPQFNAAAESPESLAKLQEARDMPWDKAMFKSLIKEGTDLFTKSRSQMLNALGGQRAVLSGRREQAKRNNNFAPIANEHPYATFAGAMLPYIQPGARLYKGVEGGLNKLFANNPISRMKMARNPAFVGGTAGAIEGGVAASGKEQNIPLGIGMGALFGGAGGKFADWATKTALPLTDSMKSALKIIDDEGMFALPGVRSNLKRLQEKDASMAIGSKTSDVSDAINDFNNEKLTRLALKDTGIKADNAAPEVLRTKYAEYRKGFEDLVNRSEGKLDNQFIDDFNGAIKTYEQTLKTKVSPVVREYHDQVYKIIDDVDGATISGDKFQEFYSGISDAINARSGIPDLQARTELRALTDMRSAVDDNIERYMDPALRGRNKELRRNYAAIKILQEGNVIDRASGRIDPMALDLQLNKPRNRQSYQEMNPSAPFYNMYKAARAGMQLHPQSGATLSGAQDLATAVKKPGDSPENLYQYFKGKGNKLTMGESILDSLYRRGYPDIVGGLRMPNKSLPYLQSGLSAGSIDMMRGLYGDPNSMLQKSAAAVSEGTKDWAPIESTYNFLTGKYED